MIHKKTLAKFFTAFTTDKYSLLLDGRSDAVYPKEIIKRSRLPRNTVFRVLKQGMQLGYIGKSGRKYHLKWPFETARKPEELTGVWRQVYNTKLKQVADDNPKFSVETLPDYIKEIVKTWCLHDKFWVEKLGQSKFYDALYSDRQKLAMHKGFYPAPIDKDELKWKEQFDKLILKKLRAESKTTFT